MNKNKIAAELTDIAKLVTASYDGDVLKGYLETALWSSNDESDESGGDPMDENYDVSDISSSAKSKSKRDVKKFLQKAGDLVLADGNDAFQIGHDLWLNRNGHGAGFWDGDYPEAGDELDKIAKRMGELSIYVGDDGEIYID